MNDGLFDGLDFVQVKPGSYPAETHTEPGTIVKGDFWSVLLRGDRYVLDYISGEIGGRARQLEISEAEARTLSVGDNQAAIAIINAHGGG